MLGTRADREAQVIQADSLQVEPITGLGDRRRPNNIPLVANTTPPWPSGAREDDELLGRSGHRDIAVDRSFDARRRTPLGR